MHGWAAKKMICKLEFVGVVGVLRAPARVPLVRAKGTKTRRGTAQRNLRPFGHDSNSPTPRTPAARASDGTFLEFVILWIMKDPYQDPFYFWTRALRPTWAKIWCFLRFLLILILFLTK